jgi:MFS family permease
MSKFPFFDQVPVTDQRSYRIDAIAAAYYGLFLGFHLPFVPLLLKRLGASPLEMGLGLSAPFIAYLVAFPLYRFFQASKAMDLVTVPVFFTRLMVGLIGFTANPQAILLIHLISQFAEGFGANPYTRVLKSMYSNDGRGQAMGYVRTCNAVFQILAAGLGGYMLDQGHGRLLFILAGVSGAVSAWYFRRVFPDPVSSPGFSPGRNVRLPDLWRTNRESRGFLWLNISVMAFGFGNLLMIGVLPTHLVEHFDISNSALGILSALTNATLVVGYSLMGIFSARQGGDRAMLVGFVAGMGNPWFFLLAPTVGYLAAPYIFMGVVNASFDIAWNLMVIRFAREEDISAFASVYTFLMGVRGVIASLLGNLLLPVTGTVPLFFAAGLCTVAGTVLALWHRRELRGA